MQRCLTGLGLGCVAGRPHPKPHLAGYQSEKRMKSMAYTVEQLAPGSYDVLLGGALIAALVRVVDSQGLSDQWQIDLLEEDPSVDRPTPFTSQNHTFHSRLAALDWLGIRPAAEGASEASR